MEARANQSTKRETQTIKITMIKGSWTPEEDRKLAEVIAIHGAKKWKLVAAKAGLNRCGKSCRLRWLNYLRPNIKRGNISDQEEDLILRLHKLLGNRWSLIAGRLPGRTDNEIKNYWNSHLSKKMNKKEREIGTSSTRERSKDEKETADQEAIVVKATQEENSSNNNNANSSSGEEDSNDSFNVDDFFDFSNEDPFNLEWMSQFVELNGSFTAMS